MKIEQKQLLDWICKILLLLMFSSLYAMGGSQDFWGGELWVRRWFAPFFLMLFAFLYSRDWRDIAFYPLVCGALTLPYGADSVMEKISLRLVFGLAVAIAFNVPNLLRKNFVLCGFGLLLGIISSILLGVWNPTPNAIEEQGSIALLLGFTYTIGIKRKGETI